MSNAKKRKNTTEEQELESAFRQLSHTPKRPSKESHRSSAVVIAICSALIAIFFCLGATAFYLHNVEMNSIIAGNISVAGVNLKGMTQAEAISHVEMAVKNTYGTKSMTVTVLDHSIQLSPSCVKNLDIRKAVKAAYRQGAVMQLSVLNLEQFLDVDETAIRQGLSELGKYYNTTLNNSSYKLSGTEPNLILEITLGTPEYGLDLDLLYKNVLAAYSLNTFHTEGQCDFIEPTPVDLVAIQELHQRHPVDAYYDKDSNQIVSGVVGYGFDIENAKELLASAEYGETIQIPFACIQPSVTETDISAMLYRDILGTFTAKSSSQSNRDTNLQLACQAINGLILKPGDAFSYNEALGERTPERGYKLAGSYAGNQTVNTYGGGICQVSSSLYYCVLSAELNVIERTNHGFLPSYMPRGMDATVNWGTLDFRFENSLDFPIRIEATSNGGTTTVTILGTDVRNYRVKLDATIIAKTAYSTEYQVMSANNPDGYKDGDYIVTPYTGYQVESYLYKYEKDSDKLIEKIYIDDSNYRARNAVICKIDTTLDETPPTGDGTVDGSNSDTESIPDPSTNDTP